MPSGAGPGRVCCSPDRDGRAYGPPGHSAPTRVQRERPNRPRKHPLLAAMTVVRHVLPLVTARDGSSVRKGADPPSSCSSGCHRSLAVAAQIGHYLSCLRTSACPRLPVWFLAGPVGHLSADRWQPASYRVPAVPRGTDAGRRSAARSPRSAFVPLLPVVGVSPICLMSGCLWGAREVASRQGSEPTSAGAAPGLGRGCARVTGGGYRQVPLPDRHRN